MSEVFAVSSSDPASAAPTPPAASRLTPLAQRTVPSRPPPQGRTLELVDSDFMATALDSRWPDSTAGRQDLLLLDPAGRDAPGVLRTLADATGAPISGLRVLSPAGLLEVARVDEVRLPSGPGLPRLVRHLQTRRLQPSHPSPALDRLWRQTRLGVLLLDKLPRESAQVWLDRLAVLRRDLRGESPTWAVVCTDELRAANAWIGAPGAASPLHLCEPPALKATPSATWNAVFRTWDTLR